MKSGRTFLSAIGRRSPKKIDLPNDSPITWLPKVCENGCVLYQKTTLHASASIGLNSFPKITRLCLTRCENLHACKNFVRAVASGRRTRHSLPVTLCG